jgi:enoyl-CoA hydratase/carnithine racemase
MEMGEAITYQQDGRLAHLILNRPEKFNCINLAMLSELMSAVEKAEQTASVRVLMLSAEGDHFCTGADLDEVKQHSRSRASLDEFISYGHVVMQRLESSSLPVVAAVNGYCLAGGMELMMCADVVFAAESARIGCQHARYGLVPGWGGTQRLPRLVGLRRALELMYSARWLDAGEARDWGLVNHVVQDSKADMAATQLAAEISYGNPEGLAAMKRLAREGAALPLGESLELEQSFSVPALMSDNVAEGLRAFSEKRRPEFLTT